MPRQRFIWPSLWEDPELGRVSLLAFTLYVGCFSNADDDGRIRGDPVFLKGQVFRYRNVTAAQVRKARDELEQACSQFCVYNVRGNDYIAFHNWEAFQHPKYRKASTLPPPPSVNIPPTLGEDSSNVPVQGSSSGSGSSLGSGSGSSLARQDELWEALEHELGVVATRSERGKRNEALKQLREVRATPAQVAAKCAAYRRRWPDMEITDQALIKHWSHLDTEAPRPALSELDQEFIHFAGGSA